MGRGSLSHSAPVSPAFSVYADRSSPRRTLPVASPKKHQVERSTRISSPSDPGTPVWSDTIARLSVTEVLDNRSVTGVLVRGGFGWIRRGRLNSGQWVAIKVLQPRDLKVKLIEESRRFRNEVKIWSRLEHENVLPLLGLVQLPIESFAEAETGLVSPWMKEGNIKDFCLKHPDLDRLPLASFLPNELFAGILSGLSYLHKLSVVHGDLRGANILISERGKPLLCDFGLANVVEDLANMSVSSVLQGSGNCRWMAPELLMDDGHPSKESDMWAFGMVILELTTNKPPFHAKNEAQVVIALYMSERPGRPSGDENANVITDDLWTTAESCWETEPGRRPSTVDLLPLFMPLTHDWATIHFA